MRKPTSRGFCTKCGTKLIADEAISQPTPPPAHETITPVSTIAEDTQHTQPNNATKENRGLRNLEKIGRVIFGISVLLMLLCSFVSLPINQIIIVVGVAIGIILSALGLKRPLRITKIIELAVAGFLLILVIIGAIMTSGGGNDKYIKIVKDGTLDGYPQKTVGKAFDEFLDNPKWESGLTENDERFVNVKGGIVYFDKEAELVVQFFVDEKNETFLYNACEINGTPQNNLVFWNLLETIYNDDSALAASASQSNLDTASNDNRIVVGETQYYDNEFGNMEVTLDYIEFIDKIENPLIGGYNYPDEGSIFLRTAFTLKNMGTEKGSLITAWSAAVYDGMYEFKNLYTEGTLTNINPLTPPATGSIIFMLPNDVAESDKSLAININDGSGSAVISYEIRPDANTSNQSGTAGATYFVDQSSETNQPTLILYPDGKFTLLANLYTGVGIIHGTYKQDDNGHIFNVETKSYSGAIGDDVNNFYMEADGDSLIYASTQQIGMTAEGSRFSMSNDIPETMKEFANSSGDENYNNTSATTTTADFVGTYSYDASYENPDGGWVNHYHSLEISLDNTDLLVSYTCRGNYLFDHVRVTPNSLTGNMLVFDTSTSTVIIPAEIIAENLYIPYQVKDLDMGLAEKIENTALQQLQQFRITDFPVDFDPFAEDEMTDDSQADISSLEETEPEVPEEDIEKLSTPADIQPDSEAQTAATSATPKEAEKTQQDDSEKPPVFEYAGATETIEDTSKTFDELCIEKSSDFPEPEDGKRVSWTVEYGKITKTVADPKGMSIGKMKSDIETSKEFADSLKKRKQQVKSSRFCRLVTAMFTRYGTQKWGDLSRRLSVVSNSLMCGPGLSRLCPLFRRS